MNPDFYRAFEDRHRGTRESIQERQRAYLAFLGPLAQLLPGAMLADLGCGRGEWLELVRSEGWAAQGVDLDEGMLRACRDLGLDVRQGDALAYLRGLPDASVAVVSAFHVAEHLPFDVLQALTAEALRVLRPGGLLVLETPNPENLVVGSSGFYMDPTHARPLPPQLLAFLAEFQGFSRVKTLRLHEGITGRADPRVSLIDVLAGVSPDYAVIAQKEPPAEAGDAARQAAAAMLDAAFAREWGVTLNQLAERHEQEWAARLREAQVTAELARDAALAAQAMHRHALERAGAMERQAVDEMFKAKRELREQVEAIHASSSWRVTAPLRWLGAQRLALREKGASGALRHVARESLLAVPRAGLRSLNRFPRARRAVGRVLRAVGLDAYLRRLRAQTAAPLPISEPGDMSATARRVHTALRHALDLRAKNPPKDH